MTVFGPFSVEQSYQYNVAELLTPHKSEKFIYKSSSFVSHSTPRYSKVTGSNNYAHYNCVDAATMSRANGPHPNPAPTLSEEMETTYHEIRPGRYVSSLNQTLSPAPLSAKEDNGYKNRIKNKPNRPNNFVSSLNCTLSPVSLPAKDDDLAENFSKSMPK